MMNGAAAWMVSLSALALSQIDPAFTFI